MLCHPLLDASSGLATKVLETDAENNILIQACNAFPGAMILLFVEYVEENTKQNLPKTMSNLKRSDTLSKVFETHLHKCLVDSKTLQEF